MHKYKGTNTRAPILGHYCANVGALLHKYKGMGVNMGWNELIL
jgi:hypothetical protein